MQNRKPIYPNIAVMVNSINTIEFQTFLRKQHTNGKWYLCCFWKSCINVSQQKNLLEFNIFNSEIYNYMILGRVPIDDNGKCLLKDPISENDLYVLDNDQRTEEERLISIQKGEKQP